MKRSLFGCGILFCGLMAARAAGPSPTPSNSPALEKTPLPSGPLVSRMPTFSMWRVLYSYASDKAAPKVGGGGKPPAPDRQSDVMVLPPRAVTITRTMPIYHIARVDTDNRVEELWFDGSNPYVISPGLPGPSLPGRNASGGSAIPSELDFSHTDFPDVEWVSPQTYLGTLKGESTSYLLFRKGDTGPTVWIDADTRRPARWQNSSETRTFEYLNAPAEKLTLPPAVLEASKTIRRIDEITSHRPPRGS